MINFEILINDKFLNVTNDNKLNPIDNKRVFSLANDFENGDWNYKKFQKFIWNNIKETALSYKERKSLALEGEDSVISNASINLRLTDSDKEDSGRGSEIAEILLYGIMKDFYGALPIVPKIFYKQNPKDYAKGADSVHIVVNDNDFSLWFGESKFYKSIKNTDLNKIIDSVSNSIALKSIKKENSLITNLSDLNDFSEISDTLRTKILKSLSQNESIDNIKPILNIPILLLHECEITKNATHLTKEYLNDIKMFHKDRATIYFEKQIEKCKDVDLYSEIKFHLILFPVPEKKPIVEKFIAKAELYRS